MRTKTQCSGAVTATTIYAPLIPLSVLSLVFSVVLIAAPVSAQLPDDFRYVEIPGGTDKHAPMQAFLADQFPTVVDGDERLRPMVDKINAHLDSRDMILIYSSFFFVEDEQLTFARIVGRDSNVREITNPRIAELVAPQLPWNAIYYQPVWGTGPPWCDKYVATHYTGETVVFVNVVTQPAEFDPHEAVHILHIQNMPPDTGFAERNELEKYFELEALALDLAVTPDFEILDDSVERIRNAMNLTNENHTQYDAGRLFSHYFARQGIDSLEELTPEERQAHGINLLELATKYGPAFSKRRW